jgi:vesicle coat complex subunit
MLFLGQKNISTAYKEPLSSLRLILSQVISKYMWMRKTYIRQHSEHATVIISFVSCLTVLPMHPQAAMDNIFNKYLDEYVVIFLDDILIFSKDPTKHAQHLTVVMETLQKHGYFARLHKCSFAETMVEFLGNVIFYNTIAMDNEELQGVQDWPRPTMTKQVRGFLGLGGYYRRIIKDFAMMAAPLHDLTQHDKI